MGAFNRLCSECGVRAFCPGGGTLSYHPLSVERDILDLRNGFVDQDVPVLAGVLSRFLVALGFVGSGKGLDSRASLDIRGCACVCVHVCV